MVNGIRRCPTERTGPILPVVISGAKIAGSNNLAYAAIRLLRRKPDISAFLFEYPEYLKERFNTKRPAEVVAARAIRFNLKVLADGPSTKLWESMLRAHGLS